ncbi:MAG: alpha/beta hydrolase [Erythrobacter sp.]
MPSDTLIELRSPKLSLKMRLVKWLMSRQDPIFPYDPAALREKIATRDLPPDAPLPAKIAAKHIVEEWEFEGQKVITLHPKSGPADWQMLYFHGGGFVLPIFDIHWSLASELVRVAGVSITMPLYHVVPEFPYSAADRLADAAFARLCEKHDPANIVLCGDSAGGHMALSLAHRLAQSDGPQPGKLALFAPWLDVTLADEAMREVEPHDFILKVDSVRVCGSIWAGDRDPADPVCSPLFADSDALAKLPPTRIFTGQHDIFIVDSRTYAEKLHAAGGDVKLYEYGGAPHVFMAITPTRESKDTVALVRDFLAET